MLFWYDACWVNKLEEMRGDVKVIIVNGNLYYFGIEALLPVASCATGS